MRAHSVILAAFCLQAALVSASGGQAGEQIGEALAVIDQATATGTAGEQTLRVGMQLASGDRIKTDGIGQAQLLFKDGTRLVVGPNSELELDEFVFRAEAAENKFVVNAFNGAFRFITGGAEKDAYLIRTPSATIGVRGTIFDFAVDAGETNLLLLHGGATVCGETGECTLADIEN